ncbi:MAG TPA: DUF309 domain-containing protein [Candidatus Aquilonibacter sp.]|nr:DUF309 domain-containing protein [Candidatus Aquilonibacter sp.]
MNDDEKKFESGLAHFNSARFFEAHEAWEELWLAAAEPEKTYLQGLIQVAAAFHHQARGNPGGAQSLLAAGTAKLAHCPDEYRGLAVADLRGEIAQWVEILSRRDGCGERKPPLIRRNQMPG